MRYVSIFSGIEAASVAWEPLGWEPVAFCEIDEFPSAVLAHHWPDVPNLGDITKVDWTAFKEEYGAVELVVGGSPCQSFSIAGKREGLSGESGLMWEYVRCVRELMPDWLIWENVPGALSSGPKGSKGEDFRCLLDALDECGYGLAWRVLDAQFFGVAQRRRRVFLVGHLGDMRACEVLFEPESLCWDNPPSREKKQELTRAARRGLAVGGGERAITLQTDHLGQNDRNHSVEICKTLDVASAPPAVFSPSLTCLHEQPIIFDRAAYSQGENAQYNPRIEKSDTAPTLVANGPAGVCVKEDTSDAHAVTIHDGTRWVVRRLTPTECERLQGFPDGHTDIGDWVDSKGKVRKTSDGARYKALGNSFAIPCVRWIAERIAAVESCEP